MLYLGASHNLMHKRIMDQLGLDVTRPYKDIFSFDSNKVKCLVFIKYLVISLAQILAKTLVMDVVVADIPSNFGMLLSRIWVAKLKGALQMDMLYSTIPIFGIQRRIFREKKLSYMVTSDESTQNHPIYSLETYMSSAIFFTYEDEDSSHFHNASFIPFE